MKTEKKSNAPKTSWCAKECERPILTAMDWNDYRDFRNQHFFDFRPNIEKLKTNM